MSYPNDGKILSETAEVVDVDGLLLDCRISNRHWKILDGFGDPPTESVWIAEVTLPDTMSQSWGCGYGETKDDAIKNLKGHVRAIKNFSESRA